jgi:hypothetical protein
MKTRLPNPADRARALVAQMTLAEKSSQMLHESPAIPRLGIAAYNWWNECLHGVARAGVATVFPQAIGLAATWNTALLHRVADVIATEARAKHHAARKRGRHAQYFGLTFWTPNINIFRDPRWGRGHETYGECPFLTSRLAVAFIRGLQGDDPRHLKVAACAKHFAVHSGPESARHSFDARVSARDLWETYLPAFDDYRLAGRTYRYFTGTPLDPFGYGLSYTRFTYRGLKLKPDRAGHLHVTARVKNTGPRAGDEVAQLYVTRAGGPLRDLRAFERFHLKPGQERALHFTLTRDALAVVTETGDREFRPGDFQISLGGSQPDPRSRELTGSAPLTATIRLG